MLDALYEIGVRAVRERRTHIGMTALDEVVLALDATCYMAVGDLRRYCLHNWVRTTRHVADLRVAEEHEFFMRGTQAFFPGINMWGSSLQTVLHNASVRSPEVASDLAAELSPWFDQQLRAFGARRIGENGYFATEGLALLYCLTLHQAYITSKTSLARTEEAKVLVDPMIRWAQRLDREGEGQALLDPDIAELVWSILLSAGYCSPDSKIAVEGGRAVLNTILPLLGQAEVDGFVAECVVGLMILSDRPDDAIQHAMEDLQPDNAWGWDRGLHIAGLGRVPALNRNLVTASADAFDPVNEWAVSRFPSFASAEP
jgi:hypothetical protein